MKSLKKYCILLYFLFISTFIFSSSVKNITSSNELQDAINTGKPVLVDFFAVWCPPCKMLGPILDELSDEYKGKITFLKIDVDKFNDLATKYKISGIPDVRIFNNGTEKQQMVGLNTKKEYKKVLDKLL